MPDVMAVTLKAWRAGVPLIGKIDRRFDEPQRAQGNQERLETDGAYLYAIIFFNPFRSTKRLTPDFTRRQLKAFSSHRKEESSKPCYRGSG